MIFAWIVNFKYFVKSENGGKSDVLFLSFDTLLFLERKNALQIAKKNMYSLERW